MSAIGLTLFAKRQTMQYWCQYCFMLF